AAVRRGHGRERGGDAQVAEEVGLEDAADLVLRPGEVVTGRGDARVVDHQVDVGGRSGGARGVLRRGEVEGEGAHTLIVPLPWRAGRGVDGARAALERLPHEVLTEAAVRARDEERAPAECLAHLHALLTRRLSPDQYVGWVPTFAGRVHCVC